MTQKTPAAGQIATMIIRTFSTIGLTLGLLLGTLEFSQAAVAQPIAFGDALSAVGEHHEGVAPEGFMKAGFRRHRGSRHGFFKGGHGVKLYRFGGHRFGKRRFYGYGQRFDSHHHGKHNAYKHGHRHSGHGFGKHHFKRSH